MRNRFLLLPIIVILASCTSSVAEKSRENDLEKHDSTMVKREPEKSVDEEDAEAISQEFGLGKCSAVTRLRDVSSDGFLGESWRVREGTECFRRWNERQERYSILMHLDISKVERDRLPWLCSETGDHISECVSQGTDVTMLVQQPRGANFILLRRITKMAAK